jgi:hypothetical protein
MNLRPGNLSNLFVCHSLRAGFFEVIPTIGFFTTASLKWSTTAAMAKTPPSRSYKLFSVMFDTVSKRHTTQQAETFCGNQEGALPQS